MICSNCLMKKLEEDRKKAMKKYNDKLKKDKYYGSSKQTKRK